MSARRPGGPVLAIETSGRDGTVALAIDGRARAQSRLGAPRGHSAALIPAIEALLARHEIPVARLVGIAVGSGPGSFTGVRVGAAAAKALASTLGIPLFPTSSLRAAAVAAAGGVADAHADQGAAVMPGEVAVGQPDPAAAVVPGGVPGNQANEIAAAAGGVTVGQAGGDAGGDPDEVAAAPGGRTGARGRPVRSRYVLFDARGGRLYAACYRIVAGSVAETVAPCATTIVGVLNGRPWRNTVFLGSGATAHAGLLRAAGYAVAFPPQGNPDARSVIRACTWEPADPATWEPDYLREWKPG